MAHRIPKACDGALHQPTAKGTSLDPIPIGTTAWYRWVEQHRSFYFEAGHHLTFTARKEQRPGGWYWYAYRRSRGKLHSLYLGKSEELSLQRLNATAEAFERGGDALVGKTPRPLRVPGDQANIITFPTTHTVAEQLREPEPAPTHHLPVQLTPLIGREQEAASAVVLLRCPEVRLLTLTGTGGVGKTRLAFQVAADLLEDFADGVFFVSLAPISDPDLVLPMIAQTFDLKETPGWSPLEQLKASLRDKQLLLLLDNFEQVITAAPLLVELLQACSELKLLVTSRLRLRISGEYEFPVQPLAVPDPKHLPETATLTAYAAVALFVQRAQAIKPDFQLTASNARTIAEICLRLDGLPLAIELAAARIKLLSPQALLARLSHRLHVLTDGVQDAPVRQQTLRNTLVWSYDLLSADEQRLFRRLSVFVSDYTLEAIEAICSALRNGALSALQGVASLIDKSLLHQSRQEAEETRFLMLETIREFGLECLQGSGELEAAREAHAGYYLKLAEEAAPKLKGKEQGLWLAHLEQEHDNLRAALSWSLEPAQAGPHLETAFRLGEALREFWRVRGFYSEGRAFLEQALARWEGVTGPTRAKALSAAADFASRQSDDDRAAALYQESLVLYRELGDRRGIASSLEGLGWIIQRKGNTIALGRSLLEVSLALYREVGDKDAIAWSLHSLAETVSSQGESTRGSLLFEESLALFRELGNKRGIAWCLSQSALYLVLARGDQAVIRARLEESLALHRELGDKNGMAFHFWTAGLVAKSQGDTATTQTLIEQSLTLWQEMGDLWHACWPTSLLGRIKAEQGDFAAARAFHEESLARARGLEDLRLIPFCLEGLAIMVAAEREYAWAARLWGAAGSLHERSGIPLTPLERIDYEPAVAAVRTKLGEQPFAAAWAEGHTITLEQVLVARGPVIIHTPPSAAPNVPSLETLPATYPDGLTAREVEVLRLVAQGLSNAQIAEQLIISLLTVKAHMRSLYNKLGISSRAAATRYAIEHHLV